MTSLLLLAIEAQAKAQWRTEERILEWLLPAVACAFVFASIPRQMKNFFVSGLVADVLGGGGGLPDAGRCQLRALESGAAKNPSRPVKESPERDAVLWWRQKDETGTFDSNPGQPGDDRLFGSSLGRPDRYEGDGR
jgi:hypothetical protein